MDHLRGNLAIPSNPKLIQQHPEHLVKKLQEFKAGSRKSAVMSGVAAAQAGNARRCLVPGIQTHQAGLRGLPLSQRRRQSHPRSG